MPLGVLGCVKSLMKKHFTSTSLSRRRAASFTLALGFNPFGQLWRGKHGQERKCQEMRAQEGQARKAVILLEQVDY